MAHPQPIKNHSVYHIPLSITNKLTENVIIDLHEMFLTKGIHRIKVANQKCGHQLIHNLLHSLNYYQNVAFLSLDKPQENGIYHDLYALLNECGYLDSDGNHNFDQFFSEAFFFDFMVIEETNQLQELPWFTDLMSSISYLSFDTQLPIIIMTYN